MAAIDANVVFGVTVTPFFLKKDIIVVRYVLLPLAPVA